MRQGWHDVAMPVGRVPKVAVISFRNQRRVPWFGWIKALEDMIVDSLGATMFTLTDPEGAAARVVAERSRAKHVARKVGIQANRLLPSPKGHRFDVLIVMGNDFDEVRMLQCLDGWQDLAPMKILLQSELWQSELGKDLRLERDVFDSFELLFSSLPHAIPSLQQWLRPEVHLLLTAADVPKYLDPTGSGCGARAISVFSPGRRDASQHTGLRRYATETGAWYQFDTARLTSVDDLDVHHEMYANYVRRSGAVMCNYARFDDPSKTLDHRDAGLRLFEALAGGCVLTGDFPTSAQFHEVTEGSSGIVPWAIGDCNVPDQLRDLLNDDDAMHSIAIDHRRRALLHHDISHRARDMLGAAGIACPQAITDRIEWLQRQAVLNVVS